MNAQIMKPEVFESHRCATIIEKNCKLFNHFIEDVSSGAHSKKSPTLKVVLDSTYLDHTFEN